MSAVCRICGCLFLATMAGQLAAAQGELEEVREGVHSRARQPSSKPRPSRPNSDTAYDGWGGTGVIDSAEDLWAAVLVAPWYLPHVWFDQPVYDRFTGYAEAHGQSSYKDSFWFYDSLAYVSSARARVQYGTDFDDLQGLGGNLQVDLPLWRMTLDSSWMTYRENLGEAGTDELSLGDANLVFRFVQNTHMVWRSGVGINWLADTQSATGFNFTYGVDLLPRDPYVISTEIDLGRLGHGSLFRSRTTVGAQWREGEVYAGFEYVDIENGNLPQMLFGLRYWW